MQTEATLSDQVLGYDLGKVSTQTQFPFNLILRVPYSFHDATCLFHFALGLSLVVGSGNMCWNQKWDQMKLLLHTRCVTFDKLLAHWSLGFLICQMEMMTLVH